VIEKLVAAAVRHPAAAVGFCGWNAGRSLEEGAFDLLYEESRDLPDPVPANVLEGYRGVAYRRRFFGGGLVRFLR